MTDLDFILVPFFTLFIVALSPPTNAADDYRAYVLGTYAEGSACATPDRRWTFSATEIVGGTRTCEIKTVSKTADGNLRVDTRQCSMAGKQVEAPSLVLDVRSEDAMIVSDGRQRRLLYRCPL